MAEINNIKGITVGQYGEALQFMVVDADGNAKDISSYTSPKTAYFRDPFAIITLEYTLSFVTDGSDGQVEFTPQVGDIDKEGEWELQFKLVSPSAVRYVGPAKVKVVKALG